MVTVAARENKVKTIVVFVIIGRSAEKVALV